MSSKKTRRIATRLETRLTQRSCSTDFTSCNVTLSLACQLRCPGRLPVAATGISTEVRRTIPVVDRKSDRDFPNAANVSKRNRSFIKYPTLEVKQRQAHSQAVLVHYIESTPQMISYNSNRVMTSGTSRSRRRVFRRSRLVNVMDSRLVSAPNYCLSC